MPTLRHHIAVAADPAAVWQAVRDVARLHDRLAPGFVTATEMLPGTGAPVRRVTFANGVVVDETIVAVDDAARRLVWAIRSVEHHNGALSVAPHPIGSEVTWTADVLPAELAEAWDPLMARGMAVMKATLEGTAT